MKAALFIASLLSVLSTFGQYTIDDCVSKARQNYPLIRQYNLIENGVAFSSDMDEMDYQILAVNQTITEFQYNRQAYVSDFS